MINPVRKNMGIFIEICISLIYNSLCQVWLKMALWFLREKVLNFLNSSLFPFGKGYGPSLEKNWILTQGYFVPSLVEIGQVVLERMKMKSLQMDGKTGDQKS